MALSNQAKENAIQGMARMRAGDDEEGTGGIISLEADYKIRITCQLAETWQLRQQLHISWRSCRPLTLYVSQRAATLFGLAVRFPRVCVSTRSPR